MQLLSLPIVHANNVLAYDTRQELDVSIADAAVVCAPSIHALSIFMSNSKTKEENFWSKFMLDDIQ